MQFVYYAVAGVLLYLLSDWILLRVEAWRGVRLQQRNLVFFVIMLVLSLTTFKAIELWLAA